MRARTIVADGTVFISVDRGELLIEHGFPRGAEVTRLPVICKDVKHIFVCGRHEGTITFDALRWLRDVGISITGVYDGTPTFHGFNHVSDPLLKRSQYRAADEQYGLDITRYLLTLKLAGQREVSEALGSPATSEIDRRMTELGHADLDGCRYAEAQAAKRYFAGWCGRVGMKFEDTVPDAWHEFQKRESELIGALPMNASDPMNACLNYAYAVLEGWAVSACYRMGLDPEMGILHKDKTYRPSMASDMMEPGRPMVDRLLIGWWRDRSFKRTDFAQTSKNRIVKLTRPMTREVAELVSDAVHELYPYWEEMLDVILQNQARYDGRGPKKRTPLTQANRKRGQRK